MRRKNQKHYLITTHKVLSSDEETQLRMLLNRQIGRTTPEFFEVRDALALTLALNCGLRAGELLGLRIRDFNPDLSCLRILSLKGSNERELPISKPLAGKLRKYVLKAFKCERWSELVDLEAPLFPISYHRLSQIWDKYRPNPKKTLHCLRHTFAVNLFSTTRDVRLVQTALGHRNINNTLVYLDFVYSQNTLRGLMLEAARNYKKGKIQDEPAEDDADWPIRSKPYSRRSF